MKTIVDKKSYSTPHIECVKLDNEMSLTLESNPPSGPNEVMNINTDYFKENPLKIDIA